MGCHTQSQRGLVLISAVARLLEHPVPVPSGQAPEAEADGGFGSSARPKVNSGALNPSKPQEPLAAVGGAGWAAPKSPWSPGAGGWGRRCPALGLQVERLDAEIPAPGAAEEQAGIANADCGHTVSPWKRRSRCIAAGRCKLGKMKRSIMHLSLHSPLLGCRGAALSHPMFNSRLSEPQPCLQTHPVLALCTSWNLFVGHGFHAWCSGQDSRLPGEG